MALCQWSLSTQKHQALALPGLPFRGSTHWAHLRKILQGCREQVCARVECSPSRAAGSRSTPGLNALPSQKFLVKLGICGI